MLGGLVSSITLRFVCRRAHAVAAAIDGSWLGFIFNKTDTGYAVDDAGGLLFCTAFTTLAWVLVTFLTKPTQEKTLVAFYRKVRPGGFWKPVARKAGDVKRDRDFALSIVCVVLACLMTYGLLLGLGYMIFGRPALGVSLVVFGAIFGFATIKLTDHLKYEGGDREPKAP